MSPNSNAPAGLSQLRELKVEESGIRKAAIEANADARECRSMAGAIASVADTILQAGVRRRAELPPTTKFMSHSGPLIVLTFSSSLGMCSFFLRHQRRNCLPANAQTIKAMRGAEMAVIIAANSELGIPLCVSITWVLSSPAQLA